MDRKRKRASNFTGQEKRLLNKIIEKYLYIIENKKTDNATNKLKEAAWERLTDEFNRETTCEQRTGRSLKNLFENSKRRTKIELGKQITYSDDDSDKAAKKVLEVHKQEPPELDESESEQGTTDFITGNYLNVTVPVDIDDVDSTNNSSKYQKGNTLKQSKEATTNVTLDIKRQQLIELEFKQRDEQHKLNVQLARLKMEAQRAKILYYTQKTKTLNNNVNH